MNKRFSLLPFLNSFVSPKKKEKKRKRKKKEKKKMTEKISIHLFQMLAFSICGKIYCKGTPN